jgi:hypothetical protein
LAIMAASAQSQRQQRGVDAVRFSVTSVHVDPRTGAIRYVESDGDDGAGPTHAHAHARTTAHYLNLYRVGVGAGAGAGAGAGSSSYSDSDSDADSDSEEGHGNGTEDTPSIPYNPENYLYSEADGTVLFAVPVCPDDHPTCAICLEEVDHTSVRAILRCKHQLHEHCFWSLYDHDIATCPTCRATY